MAHHERAADSPAPPAAVTPRTVEEVIRQRLATAVGGWHGAIETALPTFAFLGMWLWRSDLKLALLASAAVIVVEFVVRLVMRTTTRYLWGAVFATGLAAAISLRTGRAEDAFLPGILINAAYAVASLVSILVRAPIIGFVVAIGDPGFQEHPLGWRKQAGVVRVAARLTWILVALYAIRVAIMGPLYLTGDVATLGLMKVVLGWPLYLLAIAAGVWLLMRGRTTLEEATRAVLHDAQSAEEGPATTDPVRPTRREIRRGQR